MGTRNAETHDLTTLADRSAIRAGAYWQISHTRQMKSRTEYVRRECVTEVRKQIMTHKRFERLIDQWVDLGIEHSQLATRIAKTTGTS